MACDAALVREPFIGSEAIAAGVLTKTQLATRCRRVFPDIYVERDVDITAALRAKASWLWTGRRGVVAGFAAAALHGSGWIDDAQVVELIHDNRRGPPGIQTHRDRIGEDEIEIIAGMPVTSPARTALDFGCWYPTMTAVAGIDALACATDVKAVDVEMLVSDMPAVGASQERAKRWAYSMPVPSLRKSPGLGSCSYRRACLDRRHKFPCATNLEARSHISIWAGKT